MCQNALGMESGAISDAQISASTEWSTSYAAIYSRLYFRGNEHIKGAWAAKTNDANQWLQIDLIGQDSFVTRVATQGRHDFVQWVTQYRLQYSNDSLTFLDYREDGKIAIKVKYLTNQINHIFLCSQFF